jgi:2-polyprenyl-6-methoxyphenol hydroxylase-like FAD-dependent oxidoreductase
MTSPTVPADACDVLVVGAGPTGLMMATLLRRAGVGVRVVDKGEQQAHESRAFAVHAKSMELLGSIGLADQFLERGLIATGVQVYIDGTRVAGFDFDDIGRDDTPYPFVLMVPQWEIEAVLVDDLARQGLRVEHGIEVTGVEQSADGVVARARDRDGRPTEIRAAYLVGADGAHSVVRKGIGLRFEGAPYPQGFLLADCKVEWPLDHDHLKLFASERNVAAFLPLRGRDVSRIIAIVPFDGAAAAVPETAGSSPATIAEVEEALRAASRIDVRLRDPVWVTRYRIHHRGVDAYGRGRVFVAGDAAHIHSPAGGQGMNTGLQDAANLAWKLALVLRGRAPAALLDTYNAERWPVGRKILERTDRLFAMVSSQSGWLATLRNALVPIVAPLLTRAAPIRARAFHFVSQLGIRYHPNGFVADAPANGAPSVWRHGVVAGCRAPNGTIAHGRDVFALLQGYRFDVLALSRLPLGADEVATTTAALAELEASTALELRTHLVAHSLIGRDARFIQAESPHVFAVYGIGRRVPQAIFLIRPDGYVAYRAPGLDIDGVRRFIAERFAK